MQVLCLEDVLKSHCRLRKTDQIKLLAEYGNFDSEWFSRVVWSDESIFVGCRPPDLVRNECISTTVKHGGRCVMVWGAFSAAGELLYCKKSINALEYRRILQKGLLPTIEKLFSKVEQSDVIFQQDNAPAHTARPPKCGLRTNPSGSCFGPVKAQT